MNMRGLDYQVKQITYNVYSYYKTRKLDPKTREHNDDINLIDTVSAVTGLSKSTVTRVIREGNALKYKDGTACFKPQDKKRQIRKKRIQVDEYTEAVIRKKVIQFYTVKNEVPSVRKLNNLLKDEKILNCSNEYLRQLLHKLGFTNAENDSAGMLRERADIVSERLEYLKAIKLYRTAGKSIFFFNETKLWNHVDRNSKLKDMPSLVIVHVGDGSGFLDKSSLMVKSRPKSEEDISFEHFENYDWMKETVLPNIPSSSVVVMNYPYCETASTIKDEKPALTATRIEMHEWLTRHNIPFKETDLKTELFQAITNHEAKMEYSIDRIIKQNGHKILYLPQKHYDLNPVAIAWEELKEKVQKKSPKILLNQYSKEKWEKCSATVKENEEDYYMHDTKVDDVIHMNQLKKEKEDDYITEEGDNSMDFDY